MKRALSLALAISVALVLGVLFIHCGNGDEPKCDAGKECCAAVACPNGETCNTAGTCVADPCPTKECCTGKACPTGETCNAAGTCETAPECCEGKSKWGDFAGNVIVFPPTATPTPAANLSVAIVGATSAMISTNPTKLTQTTTSAAGAYETDCIDLSQQSLGMLLLADDSGFDGKTGTWVPTYSGLLSIDSAADLTCVPAAPTAFALPVTLVQGLSQVPDLANIADDGFAIIFVMDKTYAPVAGAVLKKPDGTDLPTTVKVIYPNADFTAFDAKETSANGVILIPGKLTLMDVMPSKTGMTWQKGTIGTVEGFCFTRPLPAD